MEFQKPSSASICAIGQALNSLVKAIREAEDISTDSDDAPLALYIKR